MSLSINPFTYEQQRVSLSGDSCLGVDGALLHVLSALKCVCMQKRRAMVTC